MKQSLTISAILSALILCFAAATTQAAPARQATEPADDWARVQTAGKLVVGTAADYAPFEFYNSNYELDGFDIGLAKALGEQLGVEVEFNDYAFDGLLEQLQLGNIDVAIAAISVTPGRRELVDFSSLYYIGDSAVVASSSFTPTITAPADMAGFTVGVQRGTTYQAWAQQNLVDTGYIAQADLIPYATVRDMFTDLRANRLAVGLMGKLTADLAASGRGLKIVGEGLSPQRYAIAMAKGSSLVEPLNEALLTLQADGEFAELSRLYLSETPVANATTTSGAAVVLLPTTTPVPAQATPAPTPTPACIYSMKWIADLNLDDKNMSAPPILIPGQDFSKGWRVQNDGNCDWTADFALVYSSGNRIEAAMGGTNVKVGKTVKPGEQIEISVNLRAPQTYGVFQGFWRMHDDQNQAFGEVIWVGIQIPDPNPPTATPALPVAVATPIPQQPNTPINPNLRADAAFIAANQCTTLRWDIDNIRAIYFIDGGNQQGVGGHDARNVCPGATTTYTLRVVANDGGTFDFPIIINVSGNAGYSINFWVDRDNVDAGKCTTLRWDVRNVREVYLNNEGVAGVSQREVCPGDTRTYTLAVVRQDGGQDSRQVTIRVNNSQPQQQPARIRRFNVDRNMTFIGECITLSWDTHDAEGVGIERNGATILQAGPSDGSYEDCYGPVGVNEYDLIAYNRVGTDRQSLTVVVQDASD